VWVLFRESFVLFQRNAISSYFGKLLEANTVGVRDIIPLLQVLRGILRKFSTSFLRVMYLIECIFVLFYTFSRLLHIPIRLIKKVVGVFSELVEVAG
jgi:hypothetical protein